MAALATLFRKELRQHGPALAGVTLLLAAAWLVGRASLKTEQRVLTMLAMVPTFASIALPAAALYLGHRLVVAEYYGRTQRFVESLPVRRGQIVLTKACFGFGWLLLWAAAALLLGIATARASEPVTPRFAAIMAARLGAYVFALWGMVFVFGFFGRMRIPLGIGVALLLFVLERVTTLQLSRFGPLALIDESTFPLERQHLPWVAFGQSLAVGGVAFVLAYALARVREGSVVEALARRLSAREISALLVVAVGGSTLVAALTRDAPATEYRFTTEKVLRSPAGTVEVAYLEDERRPVAEQLAGALEEKLVATGKLLALSAPLPTVRIVHGPEVPADRPRLVAGGNDALVVRTNLDQLGEDGATQLFFRTLHALLLIHTRDRAGYESKHWLLDGYALNMARSGQPAPALTDPPDSDLLRAVAAAQAMDFGEGLLIDYATTSDVMGDPSAVALSASGWRVLGAHVGAEKVRALAVAAFGRRGTGDVRDTIHDWRTPMPALFERSTGWSWPDFLAEWRAALARWAGTPAAVAALAALPRGSWSTVASAQDGVGAEATLERPNAVDLPCALKHV